MKRMAAIVSSLLLAILFVSVCAINVTAVSAEDESSTNTVYANQTDALNAYYKILESFECVSVFSSQKNSNSMQSGFEGVVYPEEYGGEYIDGSELYIYLVDANERMILEYNTLTDYASNVHYLNANYSLNYLESLNSIVDEFCGDYNISSYGVDRKNNCFVIRVYNAPSDSESTSSKTYGGLTANETISELSSLINNPAIVYEV